jgi:PAS domain S-box-containing protein
VVPNLSIKDTILRSRNAKDLDLISEIAQKATGLLLENNRAMLQALFDHLPVNIIFKDEFNNILEINHGAAHNIGGTVHDFEKKNVYDLFPKIAKNCHEEDLQVLKTHEPITVFQEFTVANKSPEILIVSKIPIVTKENKRLVLTVFKKPATILYRPDALLVY